MLYFRISETLLLEIVIYYLQKKQQHRTTDIFNNMNASQNYHLSRRSQLETGMYCMISFTTLQKMTAKSTVTNRSVTVRV